MTGGDILFSVWVGALGFIAGMLVQVIVGHNELKETKEELEYTRRKMAELRTGIEQTYSVEVIEINDSTVKEEQEDLFKPF